MNSFLDTPLGWLQLSATENALQAITFQEDKPTKTKDTENRVIIKAENELQEYFNGDRTTFSVPINPEGTDFQKSVWQLLREIPYGKATTYGELAQKLGDPQKVRAVANANGQNPIPIIIPCHRVIGANGNLVGYSGGIERKEFLLKLEGALLL